MPAEITKQAVDVGIVVRDEERMLRFYRDQLGFEYQEEVTLGAGIRQHRLGCGEAVVKLVIPAELPSEANPPGGARGASGLRYWTAHVANLEALVEELRAAGTEIVVDVREARPGVRIAIVEDPEGNWVEFAQSG